VTVSPSAPGGDQILDLSFVAFDGAFSGPITPTIGVKVLGPMTIGDDYVFHVGDRCFENSAAIIAPNSTTSPSGSIVVLQGQEGTDPLALYHVYCASLLTPDGNLSTNEAQIVKLPVASRCILGTDNNLVRLADGSLLAVKDGVVWDPLPPSGPAWRTTPGIMVPPVPQMPDHDVDTPVSISSETGARWGTSVYRSVNGAQWIQVATIDTGVLANGKYGAPRPWGWNKLNNNYWADVDPGDQKKDTNGDPIWWIGGGDHSWVYACPFTGAVYLTTGYVSGHPAIQGMLLFRSTDRGKT
jgi:hypothetical protein